MRTPHAGVSGAPHVLCDETTARAAALSGRRFRKYDKLKVKGKAQLVPSFVPAGHQTAAVGRRARECVRVCVHECVRARTNSPAPSTVQVFSQTETALWGHENEHLWLRSRVSQLLQGGSGGMVIVHGAAGVGKSHMLADILKECQQTWRVGVFTGLCDAKASAWSRVLRGLFVNLRRKHEMVKSGEAGGSVDGGDPSLLRFIKTEVKSRLPAMTALLSLLNPLFQAPLFKGSTECDGLSTDGRFDLRVKLVVALLRSLPELSPFIVMLRYGESMCVEDWCIARECVLQLRGQVSVCVCAHACVCAVDTPPPTCRSSSSCRPRRRSPPPSPPPAGSASSSPTPFSTD